LRRAADPWGEGRKKDFRQKKTAATGEEKEWKKELTKQYLKDDGIPTHRFGTLSWLVC
jgi:hypothetical protein